MLQDMQSITHMKAVQVNQPVMPTLAATLELIRDWISEKIKKSTRSSECRGLYEYDQTVIAYRRYRRYIRCMKSNFSRMIHALL